MEKPYNYQFPIKIEILFDTWSRPSTFHRYSAGIMVAIPAGLQLRDNRWEFKYSQSERLHMGDPYHTLTGCIEFYIWICLGFEADRINPLGGQSYYDKARLIAENARFDNQYSHGWSYRRDLIAALVQDTLYRNLRTASYHVYAGAYYSKRGELKQARSHLVHAADLLMLGKPDQMEMRHDDHILRFVRVDELVAELRKTGSSDTIDKMQKWDYKHPDRYK